MAEAFSVSSRLTLSTNVEDVLLKLINQFERFDRVVKSSQEKLEGEKGSLTAAFAGLKLPAGLQAELTSVVNSGREFAASSREAASAWRQIADAAKVARGSSLGAGAGGPRAAGGGGRGGGRGSTGAGLWGSGDDWANARWMDQDRTAREKHQADQNHYGVFGTPEERANAMLENANRDKAEADRERADRRKFHEEYMLAQRENLDRDMKAAAQEREQRRRFNDDYALARRENTEIDRRAAAEKKAAADRIPTRHDLGQAAMGLQMGGQAGTSFFRSALGADFELEHQFALISGHGNIAHNEKDPNFLAHLRERVKDVARTTPGIKQVEVAEIFQDIMTAFGDPEEAYKELPTFAKLVNSLQLGDLHKGGKGEMKQALDLARFIENQGGALDPRTGLYEPGKFEEIAQKATSVAFATNFRVDPSDYLALQKTAREAGMMLNDHAMYEEIPYFAQSMGASRLGTALFSNLQVLLGDRATPKTEDLLGYYGMYGAKKLKTDKNGRPVLKHGQPQYEWDQSTLAGREDLKHDTPKWVHDVLGKHITDKMGLDPTKETDREKAKGIVEEVLISMTKAGQRSTIAGLYAEMYRNYEVAQKEGANIRAQSPDMQAHMLQTDPMAQVKVFLAAENEFMIALGDLVKGPALTGLKQLTEILHNITDWASKDTNKEFASNVAIIAGGFATAAQAIGTTGVAIMFAAPVIKVLAQSIGFFGGALIPFGAGGSAAAGLTGIAGGLQGLLGPIAALFGLLALGSKYETPATQGAREQIRRDMGPVSPTNMMPQDGYGIDGRPNANSLVGPQTSSAAGSTASNPLNVFVTNQLSEQSISRGVSSSQAKMFNRPPAGVSGPDPRVDPLGMFNGMLALP